jgi:hypothetical protein
MVSAAKMHQTTIRFTRDVWQQVDRAARREGVSAAEFVRNATLWTLAYEAGRRERQPAPALPAGDAVGAREREKAAASSVRTGAALLEAADVRDGAAAVWAQARLAIDEKGRR